MGVCIRREFLSPQKRREFSSLFLFRTSIVLYTQVAPENTPTRTAPNRSFVPSPGFSSSSSSSLFLELEPLELGPLRPLDTLLLLIIVGPAAYPNGVVKKSE